MEVRLASPDEAGLLWEIRNKAIRHGCHDSYDEVTLAAWTPDTMPAGYRRVVENNPFLLLMMQTFQCSIRYMGCLSARSSLIV